MIPSRSNSSNTRSKIAASRSTVLIRGESGVGKDLLAAVIHYLGTDLAAEDPLVKIDCASLPHELMESELFGYEPGAFTGASQLKRGRLELAGNGTIVLDEISALTPAMQAKLLRVIEDKRFHRLGGNSATGIEVKARLIALTNIDLEQAVARRTFREDLFYRLNVIPLIGAAAARTRRRHPSAGRASALTTQRLARQFKTFLRERAAALEAYSFPGNVRELRNVIERCLVHAPMARDRS